MTATHTFSEGPPGMQAFSRQLMKRRASQRSFWPHRAKYSARELVNFFEPTNGRPGRGALNCLATGGNSGVSRWSSLAARTVSVTVDSQVRAAGSIRIVSEFLFY